MQFEEAVRLVLEELRAIRATQEKGLKLAQWMKDALEKEGEKGEG